MKTLPSLLLALSVAACGAGVVVEPIGGGPPADPAAPVVTPPVTPATPIPKAPIGPYTGLVGTTDVSILYPLPAKGESTDFVRPSEPATHGALLTEASFATVVPAGRLDRVGVANASGYAQLALVSLRLDPCSARAGAGCTSEVRAAFQAIYERTTVGEDGDPTLGSAATDGALHVVYDVPEAELVVMMKQLLTLKQAQGGLALQELGPHPILVKQGLGGAFAQGLRVIVLEHLGSDRIGRITAFDHNFEPDSDGWGFTIFDKTSSGLTASKIPLLDRQGELLSGSSALHGPLADSSAGDSRVGQADSVGPLVVGSAARPAVGSPGAAALAATFAVALRVQNPKLTNAETTNCGNCHLAEGARLVGESVYGFSPAAAFTSSRSLAYRTERLSVTNLHAFGYLERKISIMQRTANESVLVADAMEQKVK